LWQASAVLSRRPSARLGEFWPEPERLIAVESGPPFGLPIDVHPDLDHALSEAAQSQRPEQFEALMGRLRL